MAIFALLRSSGGRPAAAWCAQLAVQPPVLRRNERRLRARPRAPWTFPASLPPRAAFASACLARLRSSASRNLRLISSSESSGSGAASGMQTSSRDGHIHSFAHVIPACRLAGWLVVIGVAAERTVMLDMEVIVRRQDLEHCASITCMIRHYVARRAQVTEGHPHN